MQQTWHLHINGQVQGVGFRPFVRLLAEQLQLNGWVNNDVDGVHIEFNATEQKAIFFLNHILEKPPVLATITDYNLSETSSKKYTSFDITHSQHKGKPNLLLTPDAAICEDCTYSIIQSVPYDRGQTTMNAFQMCPHCLKEYEDISNRRYYSQTNSCPACAIKLELYECAKEGDTLKVSSFLTSSTLDKIVTLWRAGKIVAIKGIGGYLLTCDANNEKTVQLLRKRKHRPTKPFAVMFPNLEMLKKDLEIGEAEQILLLSKVTPIVLLTQRKVSDTLKVIATSGNSSNSPIIFKDEKAINGLSAIADYIVSNNRAIVVPQDDSVAKFTYFKNQKIILRRSRGYAPSYITPNFIFSKQTIVAMGAMLKSTFTLAHQNRTPFGR